MGGTVFGFGGIAFAVLLVLFFASSSLLSFFKASSSAKRKAAETFDKGGTRDAWQVLANGGVAALAAFLLYFLPSPFFLGAFLGALGATTADTWATEIGVLSPQQPRLISTFARVQAGTSGGVTWLGTTAAVAGALFIGSGAALLAGAWPQHSPFMLMVVAVVGGTAGSFADSLLGATLQAGYYCLVCEKPTESWLHRCGATTQLVRGYSWLNNDLATLAGALVGACLLGVLS